MMVHDRELLIVIATYNELLSLPLLIERLATELPDADVLVIDDNSPDGTGRWCDQYGQTQSRFHVIHREDKLGLGTASIRGLKYAINAGFRFVATMDADLSHDPVSLRAMFNWIREPDMSNTGVMIGSRYIQGGSISGWPWYRRLSSQIVNWYAQTILALPARDNSSAFRIYRVEQLQEIDLERVQSRGYAYLEEIMLLAQRARIQVAEFPITFENRKTGSSKVDGTEVARSLAQIFKLSLHWNRSNRE